jgi:pyridinium-3,5-bisthiocarboxylic acid mononucleotide nickel chelatase
VDKILYLDCFSGISGDMMVGAMLDAGLEIGFLQKELGRLDLEGYRVRRSSVMAGALRSAKFDVEVTGAQTSRDYGDIKSLINSSRLSSYVKKTSLDIFDTIAGAEARIHGNDIEDVHFHEVGAVDSIIDITATAIGLERLGIGKVLASNIPLGNGQVSTSHGRLPVPAPATLEILKDVPVYQGDFDFEVTTPTGAGVVKTLASGFRRPSLMSIETIGYGAGSRVVQGHSRDLPNVLRILIGRDLKEHGDDMPFYSGDTVMLSANIDDSSPEILGYITEKLMARDGVLDAWVESIYMKKNRPAFKLCIICRLEEEAMAARMIFSQTSTIGIRREEVDRYCLDREIETVKLPYGDIKVKTARLGKKVINSAPEYESCRLLAEKTGIALKDIYRDAGLFLSRR